MVVSWKELRGVYTLRPYNYADYCFVRKINYYMSKMCRKNIETAVGNLKMHETRSGLSEKCPSEGSAQGTPKTGAMWQGPWGPKKELVCVGWRGPMRGARCGGLGNGGAHVHGPRGPRRRQRVRGVRPCWAPGQQGHCVRWVLGA